MALAARIIMVCSLAMMVLLVLVIAGLIVFAQDHTPMFDMVGLPEGLPGPKPWASAFMIVTLLSALACLGRGYWAIHQILKRSVQRDFLLLSKHLKSCAIAIVCFWGMIQVLLWPGSYAMIYHLPDDIRPTLEYFPLDLELVYLILSLPLFVTATALRRAAEIEEENSQFL
ncbi:hypothetical protein [Halocynthiibacter namhaensis]|uniref:hypothetical protein n=2 Tax=Halocynthiibacter namhaensis TaxID=1290553 RepID=UPI0005790240|nr:hypothetical protein [Halocynthiibacter namhaensis]